MDGCEDGVRCVGGDEVRKVIDTFGSKSGLPQDSVTIISEEYILSEIKARAEMYITPGGRMIRRV